MHKMCQASSTPTLHFNAFWFSIYVFYPLYNASLYNACMLCACMHFMHTLYAYMHCKHHMLEHCVHCMLVHCMLCTLCTYVYYMCTYAVYACMHCTILQCTMLVQFLYNACTMLCDSQYMSFIPSDSTTQTVIVYVPPEVQKVISWCLPMLPQETCPTTTISPVAAKLTSLECWTQWDQEQTVLWVRCDFITGKCFL